MIKNSTRILEKSCARCGNPFECKGEESCWCFKEPLLRKKDIEFDECVCKECLQLQYRKKLLGT